MTPASPLATSTPDQTEQLAHLPVVFLPDQGGFAFYGTTSVSVPSSTSPGAEALLLDVAAWDGEHVTVHRSPAHLIRIAEALPLLLDAWASREAHATTVFWGAVCAEALALTATGRLLPQIEEGPIEHGQVDDRAPARWRVGPWEAVDLDRVAALAAAMPPEARCAVGPDAQLSEEARETAEPRLPDAEWLVRRAIDAVADHLVRAAATTDGTPEGTTAPLLTASTVIDMAPDAGLAPDLVEWAREVAALLDPRVRVALRLEPTSRTDRAGDGPDDVDLATSDWLATVVVRQDNRHDGRHDSSVSTAAQLWAQQTATRDGTETITEILARLRAGASAWPPLDGLLDQPVPSELLLAAADVHELLAHGAAALTAVGITVEWPPELLQQVRSVAVFTPEDVPGGLGLPVEPGRGEGAFAALSLSSSMSSAATTSSAPMTLTHELMLDGVRLTAEERERLAAAYAGGAAGGAPGRPSAVVRLRGRWVLADPAIARAAGRPQTHTVTPLDAVAAALTGVARLGDQELDVEPTPWLDRLRTELTDPRPARTVTAPAGLAASLRDYQLEGLRWLARLTGLGLGACLADDMGLGKTITLIALHLHRVEVGSGPTPHAEARPDVGPTLVVCPASLLGTWEQEIRRFAPGIPVRRFHGTARDLRGADGGFVLTTYGTVRSDAALRSGPALAAHRWGMVVADEAQHVKNPSSSTARALRTILADTRVALSGTPVENNLTELWSVMDWLNPGLLGTRRQFRQRWADVIEETRDPVVAERLSRLVRPFLLRRRKSDPGVAPELPPKTVTDQVVSLTAEQVGLYEDAVSRALTEIDQAEGIGRRAMIGGLLTRLKQICNHPAQYLHEESPRFSGRSGKLEAFAELVATIRAEDGAILVFTQYVAMARLLETFLARRGVPTMLLHGGTPVARREEMVRDFQGADGVAPVFLLSLKAAGTGLTLTRADHVIHYDRWWNPAVEEQATDRAYRIGQNRPVQVHRLTSEGTIEEHIARMIESKRDLADAVLTSGEGALTELSTADLAELVTLRAGHMPNGERDHA